MRTDANPIDQSSACTPAGGEQAGLDGSAGHVRVQAQRRALGKLQPKGVALGLENVDLAPQREDELLLRVALHNGLPG
jgi:hypothetical protein